MKKEDVVPLIIALLLIAAVLLFGGCKTPQKISSVEKTELEQNIQYDIRESRNDSISERLKESIINSLIEELNITIKITEYDTDKPIIPETGKPPVKSDSEMNLTRKRDEENKEDREGEKTSTSDQQCTDNTKADLSLLDLKESGSEPAKDPYRWRYIFYILLIIVVVILYLNRSKVLKFGKEIFLKLWKW